MHVHQVDLAIIGAGPAGMAAAIKAHDLGVEKILLIERDKHLGGILQQCIHTGFGLEYFGEELTGPEYAHRFEEMVSSRPAIALMTETLVIELDSDRVVHAVNQNGVHRVIPKAVILAMGCRERPRGVLITGSRPAGIFTAGTVQKLVNMHGLLPGKRAVILGSGDIGLIMARRLTLEGMSVEGVYEINPYPGGLMRNVVQCLNDFDIPLHLQHTVVEVHGEDRLMGVSVAQVGTNRDIIESTKRYVPCDTLLLSVGLIPENELSIGAGIELNPQTRGSVVNQHYETMLPGVFACGNVLQVHDLVDHVSQEAELAAAAASAHILRQQPSIVGNSSVPILGGSGINAVTPQVLHLPHGSNHLTIRGRVKDPLRKPRIVVSSMGRTLYEEAFRVLRPAEMFSLRVPKSALDGVSIEITISAKEM